MPTDTFNATSSWVAPPGVTSAVVRCWGAGAGGESNTGGAQNSQGGGGGAYSQSTYTVTPGNSYTVTVGAAGTGGVYFGADPTDGGDSWFDSTAGVLAKGGDIGGVGGLASQGVGTIKTNGGTGGNGAGNDGGGGGGSGGDTTGGGTGGNGSGGVGGAGGAAGTTNGAAGGTGGAAASPAPNNAGTPGGGGGGSASTDGAPGKAGRITVTWTSVAPYPEAVAATNGTTATAAPVVNLPTGIVAGETLLVLIQIAVAGAIGFPAGWTELFDDSASGADDQWALAWRKADGTEGATITLSCTSGKFSAVATRISHAADPTVTPPQLSTVATGTTPTQPNPTTVTPTGGAKDYLFGVLVGMEGEATSPPTYPTGYALGQAASDSGTAGAVTTNTRTAWAFKQANAASDDPGAFTYAGVLDDWASYAIAVHPEVLTVTFVPRPPATNMSGDPGLMMRRLAGSWRRRSGLVVVPDLPPSPRPATI